jgi:hypothetical protein
VLGDAAAAVKVGRVQLEPALKRFICRQLKESSQLGPDWPLWYSAAARHFPWPKGAELSEEAAEEAIPAEVCVKHSYCLWQELRQSVEPSAPPRRDGAPLSQAGGGSHAARKRAMGKGKMRWAF